MEEVSSIIDTYAMMIMMTKSFSIWLIYIGVGVAKSIGQELVKVKYKKR